MRVISINNEFGVMFITPFFNSGRFDSSLSFGTEFTSSPLGNDKSEKTMFIYYMHFIFSNINIFMKFIF